MLVDSNRKNISDKVFNDGIANKNYSNHLFTRIAAKKKRFENIDFKYTFFDTCYFRNCVFDSCNFTGCRFINSNFVGSSFTGSKFDYAFFDKTYIDEEIMDNNCPPYENLKQKFLRSLRMNYQSLGNKDAVDKAIKLELKATKLHLYKSWNSKEAYYRKKYAGVKRFLEFFNWLKFKTLEFIWGNGESLTKLFSSTLLLMVTMTIYDVIKYEDASQLTNYTKQLAKTPQILFSITKPEYYSDLHLSVIYIIRLISFTLFMSILIKKYNRR